MRVRILGYLAIGFALFTAPALCQPSPSSRVDSLVSGVRAQLPVLAVASGPRASFDRLARSHGLPSSKYSEFVALRSIFEATRDAGFWNLRWTITDREPVSDAVWRQWSAVSSPSFLHPTAYAECDELSALLAYLARRLDVRGVGLLWPAPNHTVAVWATTGTTGQVRMVVPTTQIFLTPYDMLGTKQFDPWRQKVIYEYTRRDVQPSFSLPRDLVEFFLRQLLRYGSATDEILQYIRNLREGVLNDPGAAQEAARLALQKSKTVTDAVDRVALTQFADDMEGRPSRRRN